MATRRKSIDDIYAQTRRISDLGVQNQGNSYFLSNRAKKVGETANRYTNNIIDRIAKPDSRGVNFVDNERKVARSVYMGIAQGGQG